MNGLQESRAKNEISKIVQIAVLTIPFLFLCFFSSSYGQFTPLHIFYGISTNINTTYELGYSKSNSRVTILVLFQA